MSVVVRLKPRSTTLFENEQLVRLSPDDNFTSDFPETAGNPGAICEVILGSESTALEETVTRVINRPLPNALPAVTGTSGGGTRPIDGEALGNKTFTLYAGQTPEVPVPYALVFRDPNDNITDGDVEIDYDDEDDVNRVESWNIISDGKGPHVTAHNVKQINTIIGTNFPTGGGGAPGAGDELLVGPACEDTVHDILAVSGTTDSIPSYDPNESVETDGDGFYVMSAETTAQRIYARFPDLDDLIATKVVDVTIEAFVKNVGATSNGIDLLVRDGDAGGDNVIGSAFVTTGSETGAYTLKSSGSLSNNPITASAWTITELNDLQVGVRFNGDSPTIEKRVAFIRLRIRYRTGFLHPSIDGTDPANMDDAWQVVAKDPFTTPADDATQHIRIHPDTQDQALRWNMEDLPAEATTVNYVETHARVTYRHVGEQNGAGENDTPCGVGTAPRSNGVQRNRLEGPREQSNFGGVAIMHNLSSAIVGSRKFVGPGNPTSGGCGSVGTESDGEDVGYGNFIEISHQSVLNSASNPISPSDVNGMAAGIRMHEGIVPEYRLSRVYSQVEYLRDPVGELYFHFAVDDDPDSPDDADYMPSMHASDKYFFVDFAGIPEVTRINSAKAWIRGLVDASASEGYHLVWRMPGESDIEETVLTNTSEATTGYERTVDPWTLEPWTRERCNALQIGFKAVGETPYYEKRVILLGLDVDLDPIPDKIDTARRLVSEKLLMLGRPVGILKATLPLEFGDVGLVRDISVTHKAVPRTSRTLSFERWDRSLMRAMTKRWILEEDKVGLDSYDLRDYLVTFLFTGQTAAKGRSFDGMMIITNGVTVQFTRATNDYIEDPYAHRLQELNADEPPADLEGIVVQNGSRNLLLNSGFGEGATDVFTSWTKNGTGLAGALIEEDLEDLAWDPNFLGAPQRSVKFTGADSPGDVYLSQLIDVETGSGLSPAGGAFPVQIYHLDDDGYPLSVAFDIDPPGFAEYHFNPYDQKWATAGGTVWQTLPLRSDAREIDRVVGTLDNIETVPSSPSSSTRELNVKIGVRTFANQINHLYAVQLEGGTLASGNAKRYPTSLILTKTGPVVRDLGKLWVPNHPDHPTYYLTRHTFFCIAVPFWNGAELPEEGGAVRYIYSMVTDASNWERLYYDQDSESFLYERRISGTTYTASKFYPAVIAGRPIRLATRAISSEGDLGEDAYSTQLFVDDVRGTDGAPPASPSHGSEINLYPGSEEGTEGTAWDGRLRRIRITQQCLPDSKIRRLR